MSCRRTSVTVLHQDIGDTSGVVGGDTSARRLGRWLPMNPSIPVSASRSRSGLMTPHVARSRRSAPSTASPASRSTSCANVRRSTGRRLCSSPVPASEDEPVEADRRGQGAGGGGAGRVGGVRAGSRADQRARQDARDGAGGGALAGVAGPDLPRGRRRSSASRRRSRARPGAGSSTPPRTRAGNSTPPSTC